MVASFSMILYEWCLAWYSMELGKRDICIMTVIVGTNKKKILKDKPLKPLKRSEAEFMNVQFRWGFGAKSWEFSDLLTLQTSLKPLLLGEGGDSFVEVTSNSKEETFKTFVPITSKNSASVRRRALDMYYVCMWSTVYVWICRHSLREKYILLAITAHPLQLKAYTIQGCI